MPDGSDVSDFSGDEGTTYGSEDSSEDDDQADDAPGEAEGDAPTQTYIGQPDRRHTQETENGLFINNYFEKAFCYNGKHLIMLAHVCHNDNYVFS